MSQSPFILKVKYYAPTKQNQERNKAHATYIGTRPGAVLGKEEISLEEGDTFDLVSPEAHAKYAHERPGSHGLFGPEQEKVDIGSVQAELGEHKGLVWRMILSLKEEDATRLDMTSREQWEIKLRATVPEVSRRMGIGETNLRWVAAFHNEPGHPHVHVMMWEKQPMRTRGTLSNQERLDVRRVFMREIYAAERTQLVMDKTAERELIREFAKDDIQKAIEMRKDINFKTKDVSLELRSLGEGASSIPPRSNPKIIAELNRRLEALAKQLPGKGRVALKFMPDEVKKNAKDVADWLLSQPRMKAHFNRFLKAHEQLTRHSTMNPIAVEQAKGKAATDLRDRVAQIVLRGAADINREFRQFERVQTQPSILASNVWKAVWQGIERDQKVQQAKVELTKRKQAQRDLQRRPRRNQKERDYEFD